MIEETNKKNIELYRKYGCTKRTKEYIYTCTKCGCKCSIECSYSDQGNNLGGVGTDDVCEWKLEYEGRFIINPHTNRGFSNEESMKNVYCNTCGKKIKVVE